MRPYFLLALLCMPLFLGAEVITLSFLQLNGLPDHLDREAATQHLKRELSQYADKEVQLNGFLYPQDEGNWILSSEPHLKSCCLGANNKVSQQVFISGLSVEVASPHRVTLQGRFIIEPKWDSKGILNQLYKIENARLIPHGWPLASLVLSALGVGSAACILTLARQKSDQKRTDA